MKTFAVIALILVFSLTDNHPGRNSPVMTQVSANFTWQYTTPESQGMSSSALDALVKRLAEKGTKKLLIVKNDRIVCEWFAEGFEDKSRGHYSASLAKALVGGMSLAMAMSDGYIDPDEPACNYITSWKKSNTRQFITIRHLATHTSGMEDAEVSEEEAEKLTARGLHPHMDLPGWKGQFWRQDPDPFSVSRDSAPILNTPGTKYAYSNPGIGMLTYAVTASLKGSKFRDIRSYLKEKVYNPVGITDNEVSIGYGKTFDVDGTSLVASWGGGTFTANAAARIGRLMLRQGNWQGVQIIDSSVVRKVITYGGTALPVRSPGNPIPATTLGWYSNFDGNWNYVPRDAFAGAGAGNQVLFVVPSLNLIAVRFGDNLYDESRGEGFWAGLVNNLFNPVIEAIIEPPYSRSDLISSVDFEPAESVISFAAGSDNWPAAWADDDKLYTAYGDGFGFQPFTEIKLSLGLASVEGIPPQLTGRNIRSVTGERVGQGVNGPKASGLLMAGGTLYMLVRNMDNSKLAWSDDHGQTWEWADWSFDRSFGCPTFLNAGKNYSDAPDRYVYIYSPDEENAYNNSDRMVMARVPAGEIRNWKKYEYFSGILNGRPLWSEDIRKREPVFVNPAKCYRSGITYNRPLKRYLWVQVIQTPAGETVQGPRFRGGLGIYEAPDPWGPWKTAFYDTDWDIGPGETASIPAKWIGSDGKTCWLLFSGNDSFSLRKFSITLK